MATAQPTAQQIAQMNANQRAYCLARGLNMSQIIDTRTLTGTPGGQTATIALRPVGLLKRLIVEVSFDIAQSAAETLTRTAYGPANIFSNLTFLDLNNNTRISATGWYMTLLASMRRGAAYGAVFTNDSPFGMGAKNFDAIRCPSSVTTTQRVRMFFEVPISYSDTDLRGVIPLATTNATAQLQLTVNPTLVAPSTALDATQSVFQSSTTATGAITNFTIVTFQEYLDQIEPGAYPVLDCQTIYNLQTTSFQGFAVGQDYPILYGNQRQFYSTTVLYDNNGALNAGTDINFFSLTTANITNIWKKDVFKAALDTRLAIGNDAPPGTYYFDHRGAPIDTSTFGNMALNINFANIGNATGSIAMLGWEYFTMAQIASRISSLSAG